MKILVLNYEFPPLGGGAGNATRCLLKEFSKRDDLRIDLVTSSPNKYKEEKFARDINIYYLDINKKGNIHYQSNLDLLKYSWRAFWFCKKLKKKNRYDLLHTFFGIPCGYIAKRLKLPYIVSLRGSDVPFYNLRFFWLDKLFFRNLSKRVWRNAKRVVANSDGLKKLAKQSYKDQEIDVIYNGVNTEEFKPREKVRDTFTVISTSRLIERKGIRYLVKAFFRFNRRYSNSKLLVIGEGNLEEELKRKADSSVEFFGSVEHDKLSSFYNQADIFVLPSLNEGMSNSLLEAMASGLAIIATDTGGTKELVDNQNGIIVNKKNSQDIFSALEGLYLDRDRLQKMKLESRAKAKKMSWAKMAEKYLNIYLEAIS